MTREEIVSIIAESDARYAADIAAAAAAAARVRAVQSAQRTLRRVGLVREADALADTLRRAADALSDALAVSADYSA